MAIIEQVSVDVIPTPPEWFMNRLSLFDPYLRLKWSRSQKVWSIWRVDDQTGKEDHVMNWVNDDGSFRELGSRVFDQLARNRWYAQHPDELMKIFIDDHIEKDRRAEERCKDDLLHLSKDKYLRRKFSEVRDIAGSVPWDEWGAGKKPSSNDFDDSVKQEKKERGNAIIQPNT